MACKLAAANAPAVPFEGASFEEVMDGFFLDRLRLEAMPFWQARGGGAQDEVVDEPQPPSGKPKSDPRFCD